MPVLADETEAISRVKNEITPTRADHIRQNMDEDISVLQEETGLSRYVIETIIKAERNHYYKAHNYGPTKYERLTNEMRKFLLQADNYETMKDLSSAFNQKFEDSELTPMHYHTILKFRKKIVSEGV